MAQRRRRPLIISAICVYFFYRNLAPCASVYSLILDLSRDYYQGGFNRFHAGYRSTVHPAHWILFARVVAMFVALAGMWKMRLWGVLIFQGFVASSLWGKISTGAMSPLDLAIDLVSLSAPWIYFINTPTAQMPAQPEQQMIVELPPEDPDDSSPGERRKNPVNELIY